jgi:uncharacterized protein YegP (UPF0339 family)
MKKPKSNAPYVFDVYKDTRGEWRWRLWAKNGKIVADSAESYRNKAHTITMCDRLTDGLGRSAVAVEGVLL